MTTKTVAELETEIRVLRELVASQGKTIEMLLKQPAAAPVVVPCGLPHYPIPYVAPNPVYPGVWPYTTITVSGTAVAPLTFDGFVQHNACAAGAPNMGTVIVNTAGCAALPFVGNLS